MLQPETQHQPENEPELVVLKRGKKPRDYHTKFALSVRDNYFAVRYSRSNNCIRHVCWSCRRIQKYKASVHYAAPICCKCGDKMEYVGPKFRPPKQSDVKGWKKSKEVYEHDNFTLGGDYYNDYLEIRPTDKDTEDEKLIHVSYGSWPTPQTGWTTDKHAIVVNTPLNERNLLVNINKSESNIAKNSYTENLLKKIHEAREQGRLANNGLIMKQPIFNHQS